MGQADPGGSLIGKFTGDWVVHRPSEALALGDRAGGFDKSLIFATILSIVSADERHVWGVGPKLLAARPRAVVFALLGVLFADTVINAVMNFIPGKSLLVLHVVCLARADRVAMVIGGARHDPRGRATPHSFGRGAASVTSIAAVEYSLYRSTRRSPARTMTRCSGAVAPATSARCGRLACATSSTRSGRPPPRSSGSF